MILDLNAPSGHRDVTEVSGIFACECGKVRLSRSAMQRHQDDERIALARLDAVVPQVGPRGMRVYGGAA